MRIHQNTVQTTQKRVHTKLRIKSSTNIQQVPLTPSTSSLYCLPKILSQSSTRSEPELTNSPGPCEQHRSKQASLGSPVRSLVLPVLPLLSYLPPLPFHPLDSSDSRVPAEQAMHTNSRAPPRGTCLVCLREYIRAYRGPSEGS